MSTSVFESTMFLAILPEICLVILGILVMIFDLAWGRQRGRNLGWMVAGGLVFIIVLSLFVAQPGEGSEALWGGMIRYDQLGFFFKMLFLAAAAITALFVMDQKALGGRGEFYLLMLAATLGMTLMASAGDLVMLYLAIETTSIPLYVLAGFLIRDDKSTESGFKYFLFGALASTVMLYGFSLLYGFSGTTDLYSLADLILGGSVPLVAVAASLILVLVGFGFKISAVPFHFWAPDTYEGAPTPVAGFLSTASKAAGFVVLVRVFTVVFPPSSIDWTMVIAVISVLTMTLGNALALAQKNIKRLLAYSSIAHAGYVLIGVSAATELGTTGVVYYLLAYLVTNLAAFGIVVAVSHVTGSDELSSYAGLSRRSPWLALAMLVAMLSLAGMPPFGGFIAKVFVFAAAVQADMVWLAVIGVLNSIIGLFYYLTVLKVVYLYRSPEEEEKKPLPVSSPYAIALTLLSFGIILLGTYFGPWYEWSMAIASGMH